jgi:hypothetical protein
MNALLLWLVVAAPQQDSTVSVDNVTVNSEPVVSTESRQVSVVTPRTVGTGGNKLEAGAGYPGLHVGYMRGILSNLDLGGRISVNYGWEGAVNRVWPGFKLQAVLRAKFFDNGKLLFGGSFSPGPLFYFPPGLSVWPGFALPVALNLGIVASSALNVGVTLEVPMWILFGTNASLIVPILMGGGVEYFVSSTLALWFDLRMGPALYSNPGRGPYGASPTGGAAFTFDGKLGVGWRF